MKTSIPIAACEAEDVIGSGDPAVVRWIYCKMRDGKVAANLAYVKG